MSRSGQIGLLKLLVLRWVIVHGMDHFNTFWWCIIKTVQQTPEKNSSRIKSEILSVLQKMPGCFKLIHKPILLSVWAAFVPSLMTGSQVKPNSGLSTSEHIRTNVLSSRLHGYKTQLVSGIYLASKDGKSWSQKSHKGLNVLSHVKLLLSVLHLVDSRNRHTLNQNAWSVFYHLCQVCATLNIYYISLPTFPETWKKKRN